MRRPGQDSWGLLCVTPPPPSSPYMTQPAPCYTSTPPLTEVLLIHLPSPRRRGRTDDLRTPQSIFHVAFPPSLGSPDKFCFATTATTTATTTTTRTPLKMNRGSGVHILFILLGGAGFEGPSTAITDVNKQQTNTHRENSPGDIKALRCTALTPQGNIESITLSGFY